MATDRRPAVSVVVPFAGGDQAARSLVEGLGRLRRQPGDEVIVADNSATPTVGVEAASAAGVTVVRATRERSSYHARNVGAEAASNDWILFMDADCRPEPDLLDRYFDRPVPDDCGLLAGAVLGAPGQDGLLPAWARSRRQLSEEHLLFDPQLPHPATGTPNVLVRGVAFEALGGFHEGIRSGGDVELCWRVQDAGWKLEHRPEARVDHRYRRRLSTLVQQSVRHAAGRLWMARRYPGAWRRPRLLLPLGRCFAVAGLRLLSLRPRDAVFKLVDAVVVTASACGWTFGRNAVRPEQEDPAGVAGPRSLVVVTDAFPARSETFVYNEALALQRQSWELRVESLARPARTERSVARSLRIDYLEDDSPARKLTALAWLAARHPFGCLKDLRDRRHWRVEEDVWPLSAIAPAARRLARSGERHLHAHFAAGGALLAMRVSRLLGVPFSMTAHAYDIFQSPSNLPEKLRSARFAAAECDYAAAQLRELAGPESADRVHRIATGTDGSRFQRSSPYPGHGRVVAIGRLVEKKGFRHLVEAATLLRGNGVSEIVIAGEGPLDGELRSLVDRLGLQGFVRFTGALWGPDAVRGLLEGADVLAIPSVIAADGDRDALPLVAYEALAMEVPVVASDLVGLPELVREPWGRLVPPGDHDELATTIANLIALPAAERAEAAAQGRQYVLDHFDPERETRRLAELIARA